MRYGERKLYLLRVVQVQENKQGKRVEDTASCKSRVLVIYRLTL